ncbi:MAG: thiamine pyrophosphate-binding protein, partial [Acutalibacteraceae bacterium]
TQGHPLQMKRAVEAIANAERPVICAGGGVISAKARKELIHFAEKLNIPVVSTLMGVGMMPTEHPLYMGMLGTHGVYAANYAIHHADLIIICGARVGDRAMAKAGQIAQKAQIIHIDIDPAEIGKNMTAHIPIVGDIGIVLKKLVDGSEEAEHKDWVDFLTQKKEEHTPVFTSRDGYVDPRNFMRTLSEIVSKRSKAILVADVGENQIWSANNFAFRGGRFLTSGGLGTMGYSLGAALGAKLAKPERQVIAVCGDGSFQMMMCELATLVQHNIPVKVVIMENNRLGMVRELQDKLYGGRYSGIMLDGSPDFVTLASAYGISAEMIDDDKDVPNAIDRMLSSENPYVLVCHVAADIPSRQED